jgi:hypothetical protein
MSNEVATTSSGGGLIPGLAGLAPSKYADDKVFVEIASASSFLPYLMLCGATTNLAKEGKIGIAHYALVHSKDKFDDLTKELVALVLSWRPKALDVSNRESIVSVYDISAPEFKRIHAKAESGESDTGCMYGPEFLVWLPSLKMFGTFFMSSKSARREAPTMKALIGKAAKIRSQLVATPKHKWHAPVINLYTGAIEAFPAEAEVVDQVNRFNNPPASTTEAAPEEGDRAR